MAPHVVVPGLTDGEDHLAGLAEYVKGIRNVKRVELLPYHVLGVPKYRAWESHILWRACRPWRAELLSNGRSV